MGTTADKLNKLLATKAAIKAAIVEKGQPVSDTDTFASYEAKIKAIQTGPQLSSIVVTKNPTKTSYTAKEVFNSAGMEVKAVFSNDAYKFVTGFTVEPSGALKPTDTKVKVKYTELGATAEAEVAITVAAIKLTVPSQSGSLNYTGSALSPTWSGYDGNLMTVSGTTSAVNAGTYTATFALKDKTNYTWADGTTANKSVTWSITQLCSVTITGDWHQSGYATATINGTTYDADGDSASLTVPAGTEVLCHIKNISTNETDYLGNYMSYIKVNGETVAYAGKQSEASYTYIITGDTSIVMDGRTSSNYYHYGYIDITTV